MHLTREITRPKRRQGRALTPGNTGREGTWNRIIRLVENLIEADAEEITRDDLRRALDGDGALLRALLDRLAPPRRDRTVEIDLPSHADKADVTSALVDGVTEDTITPGEARASAKSSTFTFGGKLAN